MKKCDGCPIYITTDKGFEVNNYGCLPDYKAAKKYYLETGKFWSCHENEEKPCMGLSIRLKKEKIPVKINVLIKQNDTLADIYDTDDEEILAFRQYF